MKQKTDIVITFIILSIWGLLIVFGILTLLKPNWLSNLSDPGKNVEAISMKNIGDVFLKAKKYNKAIAQYKAALKITPKLNSAIANLAIAYQKTGNYNKAVISFNHLLTLNPEYPGVIYYNLGEIYKNTDQTNKAISNFLKAADTAPFPEKSYQNVGYLYMNNKDWTNAITNFKLAIDNKQNIENMYRGMLITNKKASADSTTNYHDIVDLLKNKNYLNQLTLFDDAIINKQLSSDISLAKTYNNLGYCLAMQKNYEEAKGYLNKAIKINPSYTEAINNLKVVNGFISK